MVVDYGAVECYGNLQMLDLGRPIEKLPVLVGLDFIVPANTRNRVAACKESIADHIAPTGLAVAFVFPSMHPDAGAIHQRAEEHRPATSALTNRQNVELVLDEPLVDAIEVEIGALRSGHRRAER